MKFSSSVIAAAAISGVSAHTIMQQIVIGGTTHGIGEGIRVPSYNGPIQDVTSGDIACNGGPNPTKSSSIVHNVAAGSTVKTIWRHSANNVIDSSHKGPVMAYMKKVSNAATDSGVGGGWFKIAEDGYSGGSWAVDKLIAANGVQSITIPSCIAPGQYLLRGELIALHSAGQRGQAQFYMECAQINVTGGGSASPATVSLPGAYSASDPGILFNLYVPNIQYTIPGPRPFTCGGSNPNPQPTTPAPTTPAPTTPPPTQTTPPPTTGGSPLYGQCGGNGWTGPTTCSSGTCKANGEWYSQCLP